MRLSSITPILFMIVIFAGWTGKATAQTQVTIYAGDVALVSETRRLRIGEQQQELVWPAVAAHLEPGSTHLAVTQGSDLTLLEERFHPLPADPLEMLAAYKGQTIEVRVAENEWIQGRLKAIRHPTLVLDQVGSQTLVPYRDDTLVRLPGPGPDIPPGPALIWQIAPQGGGQRTLTLSYLTAGLRWTVDYFGEVNAAESQLLLSAQATVHNRSGKDFEAAEITLAAGSVNRAAPTQPPRPAPRMAMADEKVMMAAPPPEPEAMADLQFYPLPSPLDLKDLAQVKRHLIAPRSIACERTYRYRSHRNPKRITAALSVTNDDASGLGIPLPAGIWRLYRRTETGLRFIGADQRPGTARNQEIVLELGQAFDLSAERRVLQRRKLSARSDEQQIEVLFKSGKQRETVRIEVEEQIGRGQWEITQSNLAPTRKDADTVTFEVPVPADGETALTYTVVRRW